ncbi:MAG: hypothetical protein ABJB66_04470 [Gemmatimonadaceae bacterium]
MATMKKSLIRGVIAAAVLTGVAACNDTDLNVVNPNSGNSTQLLGTPGDAEALIGSYYKRWSSGLYGSTTDLQGMAGVQSLMNYSNLANNCLNGRTPFTGAANTNTPGNTCFGEQFRLYQYMAEVDRVTTTYLTQVKSGKLFYTSAARDARNKAFAEFLRGVSLGYAALMHDSATVINVGQDAYDAGVLVSYKVAADSAYAALQRAIDLTNLTATGDQGFPIPPEWIPSPTSWTKPNFLQLVKSYRARIRANMARTPAERAAVDWAAVVADAQGGFTADHLIITNTTTAPINAWRTQYLAFTTWHQMPPFFIGMADVSGAYAAWIAQPVGERGSGNTSFTMVTPDLRFPQGATRAAQQADFAITSCSAASTPCKRYFVNRPGANDPAGAGWALSNYDHVRFYSWNQKGDGSGKQNGPTPFFVKAEVDLLQAEGLYRQGNFAGAAALVNISRVTAGLPPITVFDATTPVPGGANCVPKVPVAPFNVIACGNLFDALKYEKRIETAYTSYAPWYLDGRGWGELPKDTPLFWAVPFQDLQARGTAISSLYGAGPGVGNAAGSVAPLSVYGW